MSNGDRYRVTGNNDDTDVQHFFEVDEIVVEIADADLDDPDIALVENATGRKQFVARADLEPLPAGENP